MKGLSEALIEEFADKVNWYYIFDHEFTEGFIRKFADKVKWDYILETQKLSEGFIREFADKVDWRVNYLQASPVGS